MKLWHAYVALGILGGAVTVPGTVGYWKHGPIGSQVEFWRATLSTEALFLSLILDLMVLATALFVFIWFEGRRIGMSVRWRVLYLALSYLIASSAFVPFFLAHRQRMLDALSVPTGPSQPG